MQTLYLNCHSSLGEMGGQNITCADCNTLCKHSVESSLNKNNHCKQSELTGQMGSYPMEIMQSLFCQGYDTLLHAVSAVQITWTIRSDSVRVVGGHARALLLPRPERRLDFFFSIASWSMNLSVFSETPQRKASVYSETAEWIFDILNRGHRANCLLPEEESQRKILWRNTQQHPPESNEMNK